MNLIDYGRKKWDYLLKADFGGSNSGAIANGTSIESVSSGSVQAGSLYAADIGAGAISVSSGRLLVDPDNVAAWEIGFYGGESFARERGKSFFATLNYGSESSFCSILLGLNTSQDPFTANDMGWFLSGPSNYLSINGMTSVQLVTPLNSADYNLAQIMGGYSSGVPWDGSAAGYNDGYSAFIKQYGGNWTLLYKKADKVASPYYLACRVSQLNPVAFDNLNIPKVDLSHLLKPLVLDTFTDTNGTALTAHTPDVDVVGGGWSTASEGSDIIEIQSNMARGNGTTNRVFSTVDCGKSDVFIEISGDAPLSGGGGIGMIIFRFQDINNLWQFDCFNNLASLRDRVAGTFTTRSSSTCTNGTPLRYTLTANGQNIKGYLSDVEEVSFASANFETATRHGIRSDNQGDVDYIAIYPIGTNGEYSDLDRY